MIAGGTGITPVFQLIQYIALNEKNKNLKMFLLFANKTEVYIL